MVAEQIKLDYDTIVNSIVKDNVVAIEQLPLDRLRRACEPHGYGTYGRPALFVAVRSTFIMTFVIEGGRKRDKLHEVPVERTRPCRCERRVCGEKSDGSRIMDNDAVLDSP